MVNQEIKKLAQKHGGRIADGKFHWPNKIAMANFKVDFEKMCADRKAAADGPSYAAAKALFKKTADHVAMLAGRWADEQEYEDIADYQKSLQGAIGDAAIIKRMSKRPFGFIFSIPNFTAIEYQITCTASGKLTLKQI